MRRRLRGWIDAQTCRLAGHAWSWVLAVALGITDGPVCTRCGKTGRGVGAS